MFVGPSPLSYVPHSFLSYTDKMTFSQRVMNTIITFAEKIYTELVYLPKHVSLRVQIIKWRIYYLIMF